MVESKYNNLKYFSRNATGLVKALSPFQVLTFNTSFINIGLILIYTFLYVPSFHPGANMILACLIGAIIALPMAIANSMLSNIYPRSGGEYVYNSRTLCPSIGFATNFNISIWLLYYVGVSCVLFPKYGLTAIFRFIGVQTKNNIYINISSWLSSNHGMFIVGTLTLILIMIGLMISTKKMAKIQSWYFSFGLFSLLIIIFVLLSNSNSEYIKSFNNYFSFINNDFSYEKIIDKANQYGFSKMSFSMLETFLILFWPASFLFWGNASTYFGGEIKNTKRSQLFGLTGAVILSGIFLVLIIITFNKTLDKEFLGAINYLHVIGEGTVITPLFSELGAIPSSLFWGLIILIGCTYWTIAFVPLCIGAVTRNLLAWSLDRLAPEKMSQVSNKFHTPIPAILICAIIGEIAVFLHVYVPAFAFMVGVVGAFLTFMITAISATIIPFRKKDVFESSPVNKKIFGIPVISLIGILAFIGLTIVQISVLSDPYSGISISPNTDAGYGAGIPFYMFLFNIAIFLLGFLIYFMAKLIRKKQGIDISLAFLEIPPE